MMFLLGALGCGPQVEVAAEPEPDLSEGPLTAEVWMQLEDQEKYSPEMLQRLRSEDPSLKSSEEWKKFYDKVVKPGFEIDIKGQPADP